MNIDNEFSKICARALSKWGAGAQISMMIGEMAELTLALCKYRRKLGESTETKRKQVIHEIIDVEIMLSQMKELFVTSVDDLEVLRERAIARLKERLKK